MAKNKYMPKGYRIDVGKTDEAMTSNAIDYVSLAVGITIILSYFFFDNWLLELLFVAIILTSTKIAFTNHLCDEAFQQERLVTNEEFIRIHEEIENIKEKLV